MEERIKILEMQVEFLLRTLSMSHLPYNVINKYSEDGSEVEDEIWLSHIYDSITNDYIIDYNANRNAFINYNIKENIDDIIRKHELKQKFNQYLEELIIFQEKYKED